MSALRTTTAIVAAIGSRWTLLGHSLDTSGSLNTDKSLKMPPEVVRSLEPEIEAITARI